jgi:phosphopentomutase
VARAFIIVLDSVGCGGAPDAERYGDAGADTLGHIADACSAGRGDRAGLRKGPLHLPNLAALGLGAACAGSRGRTMPDLGHAGPIEGRWGHAVETAAGKDTPSGHWEIAGVPLAFMWTTFPDVVPAIPESYLAALAAAGGIAGFIGNRHANGVAIVEELGPEHCRTGRPIIYTSTDSVIQIAAHEDPAIFGLDRLYDLCRAGRGLADDLKVGRVIARPFIGDPVKGFVRTGNRKDYSLPPPGETLLDRAALAGRSVVSLGKIGDIFAHRNTGREVKAAGNMALFDRLVAETASLPEGGLLFANFVDFDSEYGHRRDVPGYAACLEAWDRRLPEFRSLLKPGDIAIITADHGNDPTWHGTDHTREHVPVLAFGPGVEAGPLPPFPSFSRIGDLAAKAIGLTAV